ncbi:hypothetical protein BH10PLA1_BH10PLA1_20960 [soil metagenome]
MTYVISQIPENTFTTEACTAAASGKTASAKTFCTKSMIVSMMVSAFLFSFTLFGMMSATSWLVDKYVVPTMAAQMKLPAPVTTTSASLTQGTDAAASVR